MAKSSNHTKENPAPNPAPAELKNPEPTSAPLQIKSAANKKAAKKKGAPAPQGCDQATLGDEICRGEKNAIPSEQKSFHPSDAGHFRGRNSDPGLLHLPLAPRPRHSGRLLAGLAGSFPPAGGRSTRSDLRTESLGNGAEFGETGFHLFDQAIDGERLGQKTTHPRFLQKLLRPVIRTLPGNKEQRRNNPRRHIRLIDF